MNDGDTQQDNRKRWFKDGIEFIEPKPLADDPKHSYGILEPTYDFDKVLYKLTFDPDTHELMINRIIIKTFQDSEYTSQVFVDIFEYLADLNKYRTRFDHDYATRAKVSVKGNQAQVIVNNIKIPKSLRKAMFWTTSQGEILHAETSVTKAWAMKKGIDLNEADNYLLNIIKKNPKLRRPKIY